MDIQFCDNCENLLYIYLDDEKLVYNCKNCNFKKDGDNTIFCVYKNDLQNKKKISNINVKMNDFVKFDPTLPSISNGNIKCKECSNTDIIYTINDVENIKYTYICKKCNAQWTN
jgi:DNA-directed RNA polymerase subunit M/transcription elongation factor TFIIS|tara:strand:+ start:475 stop:816 length:342 start_codon:yes stop_codon:yes gene_type:complete